MSERAYNKDKLEEKILGHLMKQHFLPHSTVKINKM